MDVAGLSHERGSRSNTTGGSASTRDRRGRRSAAAAVRAESGRVGQGASRTAPAAERAAGALAAVPDTADQQQAEYFVRLLAARRGLIDQHLGEYQRKIAKAEAKGDVDAVANFRRLVRIAEHDRQSVEVLIEKLCGRFNRLVPGDALAAQPRGRLAPRRPAAGVG